jgi:hypothetical protein
MFGFLNSTEYKFLFITFLLLINRHSSWKTWEEEKKKPGEAMNQNQSWKYIYTS